MKSESVEPRSGRLPSHIAGGSLRYVKKALDRILLIILGVFLIAFCAFAVRWGLDQATKLHWLFGLTLSVLIAVLLPFFIRWLWQQPLSTTNLGKHPIQGLVLNLILVVLVAMVAMTAISYILFEAALVHYTSSYPITSGRLLDYYGWHFVDSVPILEIWSIFDVDAPVKGEGLWTGLLVLVFRVLIIAPSIALIGKHVGRRADTAPSPMEA